MCVFYFTVTATAWKKVLTQTWNEEQSTVQQVQQVEAEARAKAKVEARQNANYDRVQCSHCPMTYRRVYELKKHYKHIHPMEDNPFAIKCKYCDGSFTTNRGLLQHIGKFHPEVCDQAKRIRCSFCFARFRTVEAREIHVEITHSNLALCDECGVFCLERYALLRHKQKYHGHAYHVNGWANVFKAALKK